MVRSWRPPTISKLPTGITGAVDGLEGRVLDLVVAFGDHSRLSLELAWIRHRKQNRQSRQEAYKYCVLHLATGFYITLCYFLLTEPESNRTSTVYSALANKSVNSTSYLLSFKLKLVVSTSFHWESNSERYLMAETKPGGKSTSWLGILYTRLRLVGVLDSRVKPRARAGRTTITRISIRKTYRIFSRFILNGYKLVPFDLKLI